MKALLIKTILCVYTLLASAGIYAQEESTDDKNKSPYFIVLSNDENAALPLKSTQVDVNISGVIADVNVKQVYTNTGNSTIEAIYVFPSSTRAAVYDMVMTVNDRKIKAVIEEKGKARQKYQDAKKKGKTASLLEEERPNVFKMKVTNIIPGATVEVDMRYTELLVPTNKVYEFVYPTVVGPRYVSGAEIANGSDEDWIANPYIKGENVSSTKLNIKVDLNAGLPLQDLVCSSHQNKVEFKDKTKVQLTLQEPEGGNRDFIMRYRLAGKQVETGVLLYEDPNGENYFLAMMQPPRQVEPTSIPPREYVFIVDVSGSMHGFPLEVSKTVMKDVLNQLKDSDLFNIVFFAGGSEMYAEQSVPATSENIAKAITYMDGLNGGGGTELLSALQNAMALNGNDDYARSFVILTDGYVSVEKATFDYIRNNLGKANFFSFGIGSSVNRYIIEGMAHVGYGEAFVAENQQTAQRVAKEFVQYISKPSLTNISYQFKGIEVYEVLPEKVPDLFSNRPVVISGKYKGEGKGSLLVTGNAGNKRTGSIIKFGEEDASSNQALKYLWAREKIRLLADYNDLGRDGDTRNQIISLSKKYNLLTEFTSFLAIDDQVVNPGGQQQSVKQVLPLPKGVSPKAVTGTLNIVEDEIEISEELDFDSESCEDTEIVIEVELVEEEEADAPVFFTVEEMAEYPGGQDALIKFIGSNLQYPAIAAESGIQGIVYISFTVDVDGSIKDVKVMRGVDEELDKEAVRIIKAMPKWKPARQRGKAVPVTYMIPVKFALS